MSTPEPVAQLVNPNLILSNPFSIKWEVTATLIGILVVGTGCFGGVGLLHSYGVISLPNNLARFVGTIGQAGLWTLTVGGFIVGGFIVGGAIIGVGSYKIHQTRMQQELLARMQQELLAKFSEGNLTHLPRMGCTNLEASTYYFMPKHVRKSRGQRYYVCVRKTQEDVLEATSRLSKKECKVLRQVLSELGYQSKTEAIKTLEEPQNSD